MIEGTYQELSKKIRYYLKKINLKLERENVSYTFYLR
ncbi:hypothetical protein SJAV_09030 [Sulfurisphaera javensis]|uniref:Uncharacterized protein n=1 Tax=Sulfurisphaera javensis TaxID=2049879 RepID=A0AAT9GQK1_9CREN